MKYISLVAIGILFAPACGSAQFLFKDVTASSHIYMRSAGPDDAGPGVIVFDLNGDGWDDIYMTGGLDSDKIFLNSGHGTFKNVATGDFMTHTSVDQGPWRNSPHGGIAFDYDNDGYPDIYSCCINNDMLWHNNGDGTFEDVTRKAKLNYNITDLNQSRSATFGDVRGVGFNDFYVARWIEEANFTADSGYAFKGFPNWFYVNNGNGTFTERAKEFGIDGDTAATNIALFFDYDRDGDLDLLIGNDFGSELTPNIVWKNMLMETGVLSFVNVTQEIGMQNHLFCMGIGPCDYDRDGNFDFFQTSIGADSMMRNNGSGIFTNVTDSVLPKGNGFVRSGEGFLTTSWTALSGDYDNDGWEDEFVVHGILGSFATGVPYSPLKFDTSQFLYNAGGYFTDLTDQALGGKYIDFQARGAAYLDFNHDGKLDICVGSLGFDPSVATPDYRLLENITPNPGHWLEIRFTARRTAKESIGTIVDVWAGGIVHSRQVSTGGGFGSQNSLMQHVGLGKYAFADSVVVYWPCDKNRHRQIDCYYNVPADHLYYIMENMKGEPDTTLLSLEPIAPPSSVRTASAKQPEMYPNPVGSILNVQNLGSDGTKHFEIYDLLGIKHIDVKGTDNAFSLSVADLRPGCYVLRITTNGDIVTKQFIKE